ncbi:hypothetical protein ACIRD0_08050 [Streptomyces microflavus]|uniref:hypothetical protein n=1 Tax=Streptomyces microflavus TaxID=1919 RepID=UPI0038037A15
MNDDYTDAEMNAVFDFIRARTQEDDPEAKFIKLDVFAGVCRGWARANGYRAKPNRVAVRALVEQAGYRVADTHTLGPVVTGLRFIPIGE